MPAKEMTGMKIEKAEDIGFCFGVRRALDMLEQVGRERGGVETLGAVVHNQEVIEELAKMGFRVANSLDDIKSNTVVLSAHGVSPEVEAGIRARHIDIVDTTCPFVHRAQIAARKLAEAGFFVVIYGEAEHSEVKGILGWAGGKGIATLDEKPVASLTPLPRRIGVLSQTTQIPARFIEFAKKLIEATFTRDSELRIIDTICHDIRKRQTAALELARRADLMLVIGGRTSANTNRLAELCATLTETHLIETAEEIEPSWLIGKSHVGIAAGTSTADRTIDEVVRKLEALT